jgi:hypothetical protein
MGAPVRLGSLFTDRLAYRAGTEIIAAVIGSRLYFVNASCQNAVVHC